jgi:hypothetical protein
MWDGQEEGVVGSMQYTKSKKIHFTRFQNARFFS